MALFFLFKIRIATVRRVQAVGPLLDALQPVPGRPAHSEVLALTSKKSRVEGDGGRATCETVTIESPRRKAE